MIILNMLVVGDNMNNFEEMKLKDIIEMDLKNIIKQLIIPNKNKLHYDKLISLNNSIGVVSHFNKEF